MYNWGYDPVNYNVPEEQYSATPYDYVNRVKELMTMVNEFHKRGLRVIMDVVYNHTYGGMRCSKTSPGSTTPGTNDSGTGNGINTGIPMVSRMIRGFSGVLDRCLQHRRLPFRPDWYLPLRRGPQVGRAHQLGVSRGQHPDVRRALERLLGRPQRRAAKVRYGTTRHYGQRPRGSVQRSLPRSPQRRQRRRFTKNYIFNLKTRKVAVQSRRRMGHL
jgi:hypothetical protein